MSIYYMDRPDFAPIVLNYPSRPLYSGNALALEAVADWTAITAGTEETLVSIYGTGRFSGGLLAFGGSFGWADMALIETSLYIDGGLKAKWTLQEFELYNALNLFNKASSSGASGWYYPDILHPMISPIGGKWDATNNVFTEYYVMLHFIVEFVESLEIRVKNGLTSDITAGVRAIVGYYP